MTFRTAALALTLTALAGTAHAVTTTLFDDDFAAEAAAIAPSNKANNFNALTQWSIVRGSVDLYTDGGFGLPCGSAGCLDLDGSTGQAAKLSSNASFTFTPGSTYTLTIDVAGKNGNGSEVLIFGFEGQDASSEELRMPVGDNAARSVDMTFFVTADITASLFIDHTGGDSHGILLDRVTLTQTTDAPAVPVPAALPLLLTGVGGLAFARRARRA